MSVRENKMKMEFDSRSENEGFARVAVAAFCTKLDVTVEDIADIKTAVSEAVTNCVIHGYEDCEGIIYIECSITGNEISITIRDEGKGIADVKKAMEPLYTTKPEMERSGMGFAFMEAFMDELSVESEVNVGTTVFMKKRIV